MSHAEGVQHRGLDGRREEQLVLVVEHRADLRASLVRELAPHFRVEEAGTVAAALGAVQRELPDAVLCDVRLPDAGGLDLLRRLKQDLRTADVPVLLLTGEGVVSAAIDGLLSGADDFVHEPFRPRELFARIRAHLRVRDLNRQRLHSQRMALLGTLTAGLAHEVRNPLNAVLNALPLIRQNLPGEAHRFEAAHELLAIVEDATGRIRRIVDDLLGSSRVVQTAPTTWSPNRSIENALELLGPRLQRRTVRLDLGFPGEVRGFPDRLDQVVLNLVDNAIRAVHEDGTLELRTEAVEGGVRIAVKDDGPGIPRENLERIFDPFFTTRGVGEGTGLGLHLSRQIARAHGGTLEVVSRPGEGATFLLFVPAGVRDDRVD